MPVWIGPHETPPRITSKGTQRRRPREITYAMVVLDALAFGRMHHDGFTVSLETKPSQFRLSGRSADHGGGSKHHGGCEKLGHLTFSLAPTRHLCGHPVVPAHLIYGQPIMACA
jgi:hypothetical protein